MAHRFIPLIGSFAMLFASVGTAFAEGVPHQQGSDCSACKSSAVITIDSLSETGYMLKASIGIHANPASHNRFYHIILNSREKALNDRHDMIKELNGNGDGVIQYEWRLEFPDPGASFDAISLTVADEQPCPVGDVCTVTIRSFSVEPLPAVKTH